MNVARANGMAAALVIHGGVVGAAVVESTDIAFEPHGKHYTLKPDFAAVEHRLPLSSGQRMTITPGYLVSLEQEQLDQIYARLTAGPIPDGAFHATAFSAHPRGDSRPANAVPGGLRSNVEGAALHALPQTLWARRLFDRDGRVARSAIDTGGSDVIMRFPAKIFCGQSLLDGRRESIIIDHAFNDDIEGYKDDADRLAGRNGFRVREELRMIRPGLYLGRVYAARVFAFNFTLARERAAGAGVAIAGAAAGPAEDCWSGDSARGSMNRGG